MATKVKHPKQLFITFVERCESTAEDGTRILTKLGFANAYEPHLSTFVKKRETAMQWAYGRTYDYSIRSYEERTDGVWITRQRYASGRQLPDETTRVEENLQPSVIDNIPLEGFTIAHSVSRHATSNKLWRIQDPRGFQLEISTGAFEDLVMSTTIQKGEIMAPCIWHTGKILAAA